MEASVDTFVGDRTGIEWLLGSTVEYKKLESKKTKEEWKKERKRGTENEEGKMNEMESSQSPGDDSNK